MENYEENLIQTLHSLSTHTSPLEYLEVAIVAVLEGPDSNKATVERIEKDFQNEVENGLIQVISPTSTFLKKVGRESRLEWTEKVPFTDGFKTKMANANERLVFLFEFCFQMSKNFVLLTDQAHAMRPYFPVIKEKVDSFEKENVASYVHDFGEHKLPGLGRLYSKKVIGDLAEFGALFPVGRRTIDNILQTFDGIRGTVETTSQRSDAVLFDMASELHGVKPEVEFKAVSDFQKDHEFEKAFYEKGFAWIKAPEKGDSLIMLFKEAIRISHLRITSGSPLFRDILSDGVVMACESTAETKGDDDSKCTDIGDFRDPILDINMLESVLSYPVKSLKIVFTADVKHWVIIREISIWHKEHTSLGNSTAFDKVSLV